MGLNVRQVKFVRAYCETGNATRSAVAAGYSEDTARQGGCELLTNPAIAAAIAERHQTLADIADIDEAFVLKRWREIAVADPSELTAVHYVNCRYCFGFGGKYQWSENEYFEAVAKATEQKKEPPDCAGGFDFNPIGEPNPDCSECGGEGELRVRIAETDQVKGAARQLFAGVKQTKNGIEVLMRDQDAALANISKYLGMSVDRQEVSGPRGGPMATVKLDSNDLTDDQLAAIIEGRDSPHGAL